MFYCVTKASVDYCLAIVCRTSCAITRRATFYARSRRSSPAMPTTVPPMRLLLQHGGHRNIVTNKPHTPLQNTTNLVGMPLFINKQNIIISHEHQSQTLQLKTTVASKYHNNRDFYFKTNSLPKCPRLQQNRRAICSTTTFQRTTWHGGHCTNIPWPVDRRWSSAKSASRRPARRI